MIPMLFWDGGQRERERGREREREGERGTLRRGKCHTGGGTLQRLAEVEQDLESVHGITDRSQWGDVLALLVY